MESESTCSCVIVFTTCCDVIFTFTVLVHYALLFIYFQFEVSVEVVGE